MPMKESYLAPWHSEKSYIRRRSAALADEKLGFLDGVRLGDLSIAIEDGATTRKVRRIMEKRIAQDYWKGARAAHSRGNKSRYETKHHLSNHFKNIFGCIPEGFNYEGFRYAA